MTEEKEPIKCLFTDYGIGNYEELKWGLVQMLLLSETFHQQVNKQARIWSHSLSVVKQLLGTTLWLCIMKKALVLSTMTEMLIDILNSCEILRYFLILGACPGEETRSERYLCINVEDPLGNACPSVD